MVKFKAYRYRDKLEAIELNRRIVAGEAGEAADLDFLMARIADWDLKDVETGEPIPVGQYEALTVVQIAQVEAEWTDYLDGLSEEVKKTKERNSSSS